MDKIQRPKISIVTPSFNQGEFLEDTIQSVLSQNYPNLEYIIIDGGSTDRSLEIIKKYDSKLTHWISEPDKGRGDAINKGFSRSSGEIMAWLGCGDRYCPWAFKVVSEIFQAHPEIEWLTTGSYIVWNSEGQPASCGFRRGYSRQAFFNGCYLPMLYTIQQESTFWRRSLWLKAGGYVDEELWFVPDFELWARFFKQAELYTTSVPLGGIRIHSSQQEFINTGLEVGKSIWSKHYASSSNKFYNFIQRNSLILKMLISCFKRHSLPIVEYNFETQKWETKQIKARLFNSPL